MKHLIISLFVLSLLSSCDSKSLIKQKPINFSYSKIKESKKNNKNDSIISNHLVIELFTGTHPLRNAPLTKRPGIMKIIPRKTYSFLVLEINWKKCQDGWKFSNSNLIKKGGEMLNLYSIKLDDYNLCQNGTALIKTHISPLVIGEAFNSDYLIHLNDSIINNPNDANKSTYYRGSFLDFRYHFNSNSITKEAFFFNPKTGYGDRVSFLADGIFEVRNLILSQNNTQATGSLIKEIENVTEEGIKIAIWDEYID